MDNLTQKGGKTVNEQTIRNKTEFKLLYSMYLNRKSLFVTRSRLDFHAKRNFFPENMQNRNRYIFMVGNSCNFVENRVK